MDTSWSKLSSHDDLAAVAPSPSSTPTPTSSTLLFPILENEMSNPNRPPLEDSNNALGNSHGNAASHSHGDPNVDLHDILRQTPARSTLNPVANASLFDQPLGLPPPAWGEEDIIAAWPPRSIRRAPNIGGS
ncbi:hypothetical protein HJC23_002599 [Cyclotella cryptica]|uniref:Uncharacterized protein n=1 Tax=Cyclotella cryptica TaxID=29204 RepID=A0ABD3PXL4_9STRA